jgi:hypothetical protein
MVELRASEQKLVEIVRKLPPEGLAEVIDFAQFLESRMRQADQSLDESAAPDTEENARWDTLLATDESQRLLERLADEAVADIQAGHAKPIVFTEDGEIAAG